MDLTVFCVTKNNSATIAQAIESAQPLESHVVIVDQASTDGTQDIARSLGATVRRSHEIDRSEIINDAADRCGTEWALLLQPWEVIHQGHQHILSAEKTCNVQVLNGTVISADARLWKVSDAKFENPVFEFLNQETNDVLPALFYSIGNPDYRSYISVVEDWRKKHPTSGRPVYYHALIMLALGNYDEFVRLSEHFMFLDNRPSKATTMNRFYYAMVHIYQKRVVRPAAQNLALCLAHRPLMAEFWTLMGDLYYHLHHDFKKARMFYENAIHLGSKRMANDLWPMDISKYEDYPNQMISSCQSLNSARAYYGR